MTPHSDWLAVVELLQSFGDTSRFISLGMNRAQPLKVQVHRVDAEKSPKYLDRSSWAFVKDDPQTTHCWTYAGLRLWFHPEHKCWLPYPAGGK